MTRPLRIAILGSTRATSSQALITETKAGRLNAHVTVMGTDKQNAGILMRAKDNCVEAFLLEPEKGVSRQQYDSAMVKKIKPYRPDVIFLIGYMRIVSPVFIDAFQGRIFNIHPSLLPKHAGLMDLDVHKSVLNAGDTHSGCTIHHVTETVDDGEILCQSVCNVTPTDTPETLRAKVQKLESTAWVDVVEILEKTIER